MLQHLLTRAENYRNVKRYMTYVLERFDKSDLKISDDQYLDPPVNQLYGLAGRSVAIESLMFVYDHLKYLQNRVIVKVL